MPMFQTKFAYVNSNTCLYVFLCHQPLYWTWMINGSCQYILIGYVCGTECLDVQSRWLQFPRFNSDSWRSLDMSVYDFYLVTHNYTLLRLFSHSWVRTVIESTWRDLPLLHQSMPTKCVWHMHTGNTSLLYLKIKKNYVFFLMYPRNDSWSLH